MILAYINTELWITHPAWLEFVLEVVCYVLIWQLVGYFAFEYAGQRRELNRHAQLMELEYSFKQWN